MVLGLIVAEVVKQFEVKPDEARVRELIEEMASAYQEPEQKTPPGPEASRLRMMGGL
ncbi:Trigger factor [compost metagenome]